MSARTVPTSTSLRVLVAEPEAPQRERIVGLVERAAADLKRAVVIDQVSDGTSALAQWGKHSPSLVVSEILLEGLSGLALLRRMNAEHTPAAPLIFVTRMASESDRYWGLRNGAHAYVVKPYDDQQLLDRIREVLHKGTQAPRERPFV